MEAEATPDAAARQAVADRGGGDAEVRSDPGAKCPRARRRCAHGDRAHAARRAARARRCRHGPRRGSRQPGRVRPARAEAGVPDVGGVPGRRHVLRRSRGRPRRLHGFGRGERRPVERHLRIRVPPRLRPGHRSGEVPGRGRWSVGRHVGRLPRRKRGRPVPPGARERAVLLPGRARRPPLRAVGAPHRARAPQRPQCDDVPHAEDGLRRRLQGRPEAARRAHERVRRMVGRRRLPEVRRDDELHGRPAAGGRARLPEPDGRRRGPQRLHERGPVRAELPAAHVG